jgi:geranylgeranyl diphosphate synthase type II
MQEILPYKQYIEASLANLNYAKAPTELYEPIRYTLNLGGKRMRPVLLLLACEMFGRKKEDAINQALAIEVFHNFTLLHDDIMDQAPLRRNQPTVYKKWNENIAILSGDVMFAESCKLMIKQSFESAEKVMNIFFDAAIEVCEGQQWDMNFENSHTVSVHEYLNMIELKTAALLGAALQIGACIGGASKQQAENLRMFGRKTGVAFQLMDDILDCYGNPALVGKQVGGDILANKKTYLLIRTLEKASADDRKRLEYLMHSPVSADNKVYEVLELYKYYSVKDEAEAVMLDNYHQAMDYLNKINTEHPAKLMLQTFAESLMQRSY